MGDRGNARVVYSTGTGRVCAGCGWPAGDCRCSSRTSEAPLPDRIVARLRVEKKGRGGKVVSVVYGLPQNTVFLQALCQELKRACGTGGTVARTVTAPSSCRAICANGSASCCSARDSRSKGEPKGAISWV